MKGARRTFGAAALLAGLLGTAPALADEPQGQSGEAKKPEEIAANMGGVVDSLGRKQTGAPVQGQQKQIVRDLDDLIASLEKQYQNTRNGIKRNRPRNGMRDSMISSGTGGIGDLINPNAGGKDWGQLSDRERDRILQSMTEGFPPEYRTVLERYYRRLAEEKSAKAKAAGETKAKDDGEAKAKDAGTDTPARP
jgi:hypothetical protein